MITRERILAGLKHTIVVRNPYPGGGKDSISR